MAIILLLGHLDTLQIHKNNNIDNPNNYRGITVTNAIEKLFNKI